MLIDSHGGHALIVKGLLKPDVDLNQVRAAIDQLVSTYFSQERVLSADEIKVNERAFRLLLDKLHVIMGDGYEGWLVLCPTLESRTHGHTLLLVLDDEADPRLQRLALALKCSWSNDVLNKKEQIERTLGILMDSLVLTTGLLAEEL